MTKTNIILADVLRMCARTHIMFLPQSLCVGGCACAYMDNMIQISVIHICIHCGMCMFIFLYNTLCKLFW